PEADGQRFLAVLRDERDLVLEAVLLAQHGQNVRFEHPGELGCRIGLQVQRNVTCVHEMTPSRLAMSFAADTSRRSQCAMIYYLCQVEIGRASCRERV